MNWQSMSTDRLVESMQEVKRRMAGIKRDYLRSQTDLGRCPKCHRQPTLTNEGVGETINLCETMFAALRSRVAQETARGADPLYGLRVASYPCDPRPRL